MTECSLYGTGGVLIQCRYLEYGMRYSSRDWVTAHPHSASEMSSHCQIQRISAIYRTQRHSIIGSSSLSLLLHNIPIKVQGKPPPALSRYQETRDVALGCLSRYIRICAQFPLRKKYLDQLPLPN